MKIIWNQMDPYCDVILIRDFREIIMILSWQVIFICNICDMAALVHLNHLVAIVLYKCITNTFERFFFFFELVWFSGFSPRAFLLILFLLCTEMELTIWCSLQEDAGRLKFVCFPNDGIDEHMVWYWFLLL